MPGVVDGQLAPAPSSPNCVVSHAPEDDAEHHVEPLPLGEDGAATLAEVRSIVEDMPRTEVVTHDEGYLHAVFTTGFFRFKDDVEFLVDEDAGVLHVRSASRVGYSDLGLNRKRVEEIRAALTS